MAHGSMQVRPACRLLYAFELRVPFHTISTRIHVGSATFMFDQASCRLSSTRLRRRRYRNRMLYISSTSGVSIIPKGQETCSPRRRGKTGRHMSIGRRS